MSVGRRIALAMSLLFCIVAGSEASPTQVYSIDLREPRVADALNGLSEQTGVPVVFPYDLVKGRNASPVVGRYTLQGAVDELLKASGLSGGLSDKGILTVFLAEPPVHFSGDSSVTRDENQQNSNKKTRLGGRLAGVTAFLTSVAAAFTASAQDTSEGDQTKLSQVVVSAEKRVERLQDVPVPVSVIDTQQLSDTSKLLLRDYFDSVPGLNLAPSISGGQLLSIRGVTTGGSTIPTVRILVDDVAYGYTTLPGLANVIPDIDPGDLARIEVLRGPQGTLYGANSMGGLIKYVTKDASTAGYSGRIEAGTSGVVNGAEPGFNLRASANIPLTDTFALRVSGFTRQDPGYVDNVASGIDGVNETLASGGRLAALWQPVDNLSVKLSALYQGVKYNGSSEVIKEPGLGELDQNYIPGTGEAYRQTQAYSSTVTWKLGTIEITSLTGYNILRFHDLPDFTELFSGFAAQYFNVKGSPFVDHEDARKISQELRISGTLPYGFDWLLGGFYTHEHCYGCFVTIESADVATGARSGRVAFIGTPVTFDEASAFADLTYHITDRLDVQVGGRETHYTNSNDASVSNGPFYGPDPAYYSPKYESKGNAFTYLVTPRLKLSEDLMLYARMASGYRPGAPNSASAIAQGAPNEASADKTNNYELGLKGEFLDQALSVDASLYYIDWKNIQLQLLTPQDFGYGANGSRAKSEGVELSVNAHPASGLRIGAWVSYDDAVLTEDFPSNSTVVGVSGDKLPNTSRFSGNLSAQQDFIVNSSTTAYMGAEATFVGGRESVFTATGARQHFGSYTRTDLRAGVNHESWTVNAYVNNVADVRGVLNGGLGYFIPDAFVYITPRTVGVSVSKAF